MYDEEKLLEILKDVEYRSLDANGKCFHHQTQFT